MSTRKSIKNPNVRAASIKKRQSINSVRKSDSKSLDINKTQLRVILEELKAVSREPSVKEPSVKEPSLRTVDNSQISSVSDDDNFHERGDRFQLSSKNSVGISSEDNSLCSTGMLEVVEVSIPEDEDLHEERLRHLSEQVDKCRQECERLSKEKKDLEDFQIKKQIDGITLGPNKKLIDLLIERVLDTSPEWKSKIDTLINIPTSLKGSGFLRGGDYFESIFQLAIAIGALSKFKNKFIRFYDFDKSYKKLEKKNNYLYEKTIKNSGGGEHGISDISFEVSDNELFDNTKINNSYACGEIPTDSVKSTNPFYFISVKGYNKEKDVKDSYDIPLLDQQLKVLPHLNKHIIVCVRNKKQFLDKLSNMKMDFLKHSIDYVIGYDEAIEALNQFRISFFRRIQHLDICITEGLIKQEVYKLFPKDTIYKQPLQLYFHQELVVKSVIDRIDEVNSFRRITPHFLCIGVLPRGGKSFIAGGIINEHKARYKPEGRYNVLFMTSAVNETRGQFKSDLIEKFTEFNDFNFVDVVDYDDLVSEKPNNFYFISRQLGSVSRPNEALYEESTEEDITEITKDLFSNLKEKLGLIPEIDIIFFDEAHIGITSKTVRNHFQKAFERFNIPVVLMTATYKKPSTILDTNKDLFVWDLQDIKDMKSLPITKFDGFIKKMPDVLERYPKFGKQLLIDRIRYGESLESIARPYIQFPTPNFISLTFSPDTIAHLKKTAEGYNYTTAFELNINTELLLDNSRYLEWGSMVRNREHALRLRQFLTPDIDFTNPDETDIPFLHNKERRYRALNQIFTIAQQNGSRPIIGKPFSILMFLPFNFEGSSGIGELCRVWASFMLENKYWKDNFVFLTLSPYNNPRYKKIPGITIQRAVANGICHREDFSGDLKDIIINVEKEALKHGKGLVILSGDVAKMGISLKCVDVVVLMSTNTDADDIIQKMYRALTDDPPLKKDGFIVDLNLKRVIKALFEYDLEKDRTRITNRSSVTVDERLQRVWELCNWGQDMFIEEHPEMDFNSFMKEIKERVLDDVSSDIFSDFDKNFKKLEELQLSNIREMDENLYTEIILALSGSSNPSRKKPDRLEAIRGTEIPDGARLEKADNDKAENDELSSIDDEASNSSMNPPVYEPSHEDIEKSIKTLRNIIKTFVNALVLKSAESWSHSLNLVSLLEKYKNDKKLVEETNHEINIDDCNCSSFEECKKAHDNLYETIFCEISSYAYVSRKINSKKVNIYDKEKHHKIIDIAEKIFENQSFMTEWNIYIEILLKEIKTSKKTGGRKTKKNINIYKYDSNKTY